MQSGTTLVLYGVADYNQSFWGNVTFGGSGSGTIRIDFYGSGTKELWRGSIGATTYNRTYTATLDAPGYISGLSVSLAVPASGVAAPTRAYFTASPTYVSGNKARLSFSWDGYRIYALEVQRRYWISAGNNSGWVTVGSLSANVTGTFDAPMLPGYSHTFRVRVRNSAGWTPWSNPSAEIHSDPLAPANIRATVSGASVVVTWDIVSGPGGSGSWSPQVQRSINGGEWTTVATLGDWVRSWTDTKVTAGQSVQYHVRLRPTRQPDLWGPYGSPSPAVTTYRPPTLSASVERATGSTPEPLGVNLLVRASGSCLAQSGSTMTLRARMRVKGTSTWGGWTTSVSGVTAGAISKTFVMSGTASATSSYEVQVELFDSRGSTSRTVEVGTGQVPLSISKTGIGVGKMWEEGALDVGGDMHISGRIFANGKPLSGMTTVETAASDWVDRGNFWWAHERPVSAPFTRPAGYRWALTVEGPDLWGTVNIKTQTATGAVVCFLANKGANPGTQTYFLTWQLVEG